MFSTPRRRHIAWTILYGCAAMFLLLVVATILSTRQLAYEVRSTQLEGTPTGRKLVAASDRILDCTSPEGECFKESQERTAKAVGDINRVIVLAAACATGLPQGLSVEQRQIRTQSCVIDRLALESAKP